MSKRNRLQHGLLILLASYLAVIAATLSVPAFASQLYSDALQDFNLKRYHAASDGFQKVIQNEPGNADAYFYMGRSLEELKERDGAKTMYEACFKLNPFGALARQARTQLMHLADTEASIKHPTDGVKVTEDTLRIIDWQSANLRATKILEGNRGAAWATQSGQIAAFKQNGYYQPTTTNMVRDPNAQYDNQQMLRNIKDQVARTGGVGNPYDLSRGLLPQPVAVMPPAVPYVNPNTYNYAPVALNTRGHYSNLQAMDTYYLRTDAAVRAAHYQTLGLLQATETQKSANNLKTLLAEDKNRAGPHLRALGTNLYVRNYSDHDDDSYAPEDPLLQLKATAQRLADLPVGQKAIAKSLSK
ncbi:MAG: hypothetical protein P4L53_08505 [Candidatus Obscuribacterales bacterium]|nr:hypothetical protein [Candidatus Obscuribacterales bacterium]